MYPPVTPPAVMSFCELKDKEVVNIRDGSVLGCVCDIEFRVCDGQITAICVPGSGFSHPSRQKTAWSSPGAT